MDTLNKGMQCCGKCDNKARGVKFFTFSNLCQKYIYPPQPKYNPSKKLIRVQVHSSVANWNWPIIVPHYGSIRSGTLWGTLCSSVRRYKPINSSKQIRFTSTCRTGAREDLQCKVTVITAPLSRKNFLQLLWNRSPNRLEEREESKWKLLAVEPVTWGKKQ